MRRTILIVLTLCVTLLTPACSRWQKSNATGATKVVVENESPSRPQNDAERDLMFQSAYAEGIRLVEDGRVGLALGAFEQALNARPDSIDALFNLGACHEALGDPLRAVSYYRRVLEQQPDDADCYRNLGTSFIKLYHRDNSPTWRRMACEAWNRSLQLKPAQPDVRRYLATIDAHP